jgi:hypothetical protein
VSEIFDPEAGQPPPITTKNSVDVAILVAHHLIKSGHSSLAANVEARIALGERKYGTRLKSYNGRDAIKDLMDELLDALNYAKQVEIEGLDGGGLFTDLVPLAIRVEKLHGKYVL